MCYCLSIIFVNHTQAYIKFPYITCYCLSSTNYENIDIITFPYITCYCLSIVFTPLLFFYYHTFPYFTRLFLFFPTEMLFSLISPFSFLFKGFQDFFLFQLVKFPLYYFVYYSFILIIS